MNKIESAADLKVPVPPEDVTVILSKVYDAIEELGEMAVGRGVPDKISARKLLDMLDGLDKYPVPQEDKPDYEAMWGGLEVEADAKYTKAVKRRHRHVEQFFFNLIRAMKKLRTQHTPPGAEKEKPERNDNL